MAERLGYRAVSRVGALRGVGEAPSDCDEQEAEPVAERSPRGIAFPRSALPRVAPLRRRFEIAVMQGCQSVCLPGTHDHSFSSLQK